MSKLTQSDKKEFIRIISEDLKAIGRSVGEQMRKIWNDAREGILKKSGNDKLLKRNEEINKEMMLLREEQNQIQNKLRSERLTVQQAIEFGGHSDVYGGVSGANFYGIPVNNKLDYDIAKFIQDNVDIGTTAKFIQDLAKSSLREIAMCGTFEEAHSVYETLYSLNFRRFGVDIPPRLSEFKEKITKLIGSQGGLKLIEEKQDKED